MELLRDTPFEAAWQVWMVRPGVPCLTLVVKGTFSVVPRGPCPIAGEQALLTGDLHQDDDVSRSVRYESDFAFVKPRGECFVTGSCHAPGGRPVTAVMAAFQIGAVRKKIAVIGDRHFKGLLGGQTEPKPFTEMPLCWERSFGGAKHRDNPVGLGLDRSVKGGKAVVRLPNLENPDDLIRARRQRPRPVGTHPISRSWQARMSLTGTHDARWQRTRWPWLPEDFRWDYFNAAPVDQQIKGFWKGDEKIALLNLHPEHGKVTCRLPGLRVRAFLHPRGADPGALEPLTPELDTITVDADAGLVHCLWRAVKEVPSEGLGEYDRVFVVHEELGARRRLREYRDWYLRRLAEEAEVEEQAEAAEPSAEPAEPAPSKMTPQVLSSLQEVSPPMGLSAPPARTAVASLGRASMLPNPVPLDSPVLLPALTQEELEALYAVDVDLEEEPDDATELMDEAALSAVLDTALPLSSFSGPLPFEANLEALSLDLEDLYSVDVDLDGEVQDETVTFDPRALEAAVLGGEVTGGAEADEVEDLWEPRSTVLFLESVATALLQPAPELEERAALTAPAWAGALDDSSFDDDDDAPDNDEPATTEMPTLTEEHLAQRALVREAAASGAGCKGWDLPGAVLSGLDLRGLDLSGAILTKAVLVGAMLDGADLSGAVLRGADLRGERLVGVTLREADLSQLLGQGLELREVDLDGALAEGALLSGAKLFDSTAKGAELAQIDLTGARLERTSLDGADLTEATLDGLVALDCTLIDADLGGGASARGARFDGCDLTSLRASEGVRLNRASFVRAQMTGARLQNASLRRANLSFAQLDGADFSGADLMMAKLLGCHLRGARFDGASLADVELGKSDCHQARFEGANLLRTDLRGCNLFQAEFLSARMVDTRLELAVLTGTKLA